MLAELREDNGDLARRLREAHGMIDEADDVATASILEVFIDETERRVWFLHQSSHAAPKGGCGRLRTGCLSRSCSLP